MTRRKSILGVLGVSALAICALAAFGASSASAYTLHECKAFQGGETTTRYSDSNCETVNASGSFQTVPLPLNTPTPVTATGTSNFTLAATVGGVVFEITCTGLEGPGAEATNEVVEGEMVVHGTGGTSRFTGCAVTKPVGRNCHVPTTLETVELTSITDEEGGTTYEPASGEETFITIPVTECSSPALNGNKAVKGSARSERISAPTQEFNAGSGSELTFGGQIATFTGRYHFSGPNGGILGLELP